MMHGPPNARAAVPCCACTTTYDSPLDEDVFFKAWDPDIRRAAAAAAARLRSGAVDADDLAQAARYQVLRAIRRRAITSPRYVRRVIKNAIYSVLRRERSRLDWDLGRRVELTDDIASGPVELLDDPSAWIVAWIITLPDRLRHTYELIYVRGVTQRRAADLMRVSQPRVAQLHAALLEQGRRAMVAAAA